MAEIVKIKKDGVIQYPITKPECVIDENGKNVLQLIKENSSSSYDDTELREELTRLDGELTELSAEVSELSEKVDNLPTAESDVFKAEYGKTSFAEIREAYDNGKVIHCDYKTQCYVLSRILETSAYFDAMSAPNSYRITCDSNGWVETVIQLELKTNKVTSLSESSTDTQYPSAKAVYEAIQQSGGGGVSNEWKCVADRRMLEGEKNVIFTTYADGTPLKAKEVVVQMLCDTTRQQNLNGYVIIQSTNNKNRSLYGAINFESDAATAQTPILHQMHLKASPMYMVAEICNNVKCAVATPTNQQVQGGNTPFQIYEDIVSVELAPNGALTSAAPYLKIYAR